MRLLNIVALLLVLTALSGCTPDRTSYPPTPHADFSILTYNVNFGGPDPQAAVRTIADADADIVCLQETNVAWEQLIRTSLSTTYPIIDFHNGAAAGGMALLSKFPIERINYVRPNAGWFPAAIATVRTAKGPVQFVSVHLRPPVSNSGSFVSGYFTTGSIRYTEIHELALAANDRAPRADIPRIILGDFNESDGGSAVKWLKSQGYDDALALHDRRTNTWRWQVGFIPLRNRLDHVLHTRSLVSVDCRVIKRGSSDHFPVFASFAVPSKPIPAQAGMAAMVFNAGQSR